MDKNIGERAANASIYLLNASYVQVPYFDVFGIEVYIYNFFNCRVVIATVQILFICTSKKEHSNFPYNFFRLACVYFIES